MKWPALLLLLCACRPPPAQLERRVLVDPVGDCVALRQRLSECAEDAAAALVERRAQGRPELAEGTAAREAAYADALAALRREAEISAEERARQCRLASGELPLPDPEYVARLHRCLALDCRRRALCLGPLLQSASAPPPPSVANQSPRR